MTTLKNRSDFVRIAKDGQKWVSKGLIIQALENDLGCIRVGYTVTKRVDKRAVVRNRIKRRLRAVASDVIKNEALISCDYVLIGRSETQDRPYETLKKDLRWCLKKMSFLKGE